MKKSEVGRVILGQLYRKYTKMNVTKDGYDQTVEVKGGVYLPLHFAMDQTTHRTSIIYCSYHQGEQKDFFVCTPMYFVTNFRLESEPQKPGEVLKLPTPLPVPEKILDYTCKEGTRLGGKFTPEELALVQRTETHYQGPPQ